jgi:hypothetical protein
MRGFGRSCRGQGHVFMKLVRHTERQLLALGSLSLPGAFGNAYGLTETFL